MTIQEAYLFNKYAKPLQDEIERLTNENENLKSKVMAYEELIKDLEHYLSFSTFSK